LQKCSVDQIETIREWMRCFLQQLVEPTSESILGADRSKTGQSVAVELSPNCLAIELNVEIAPGNFKMSASSVELKPSSFDQDIHRTRWACHST
jgi:hypothetical protein